MNPDVRPPSVQMKPRWPPVSVSARSWRSYKKNRGLWIVHGILSTVFTISVRASLVKTNGTLKFNYASSNYRELGCGRLRWNRRLLTRAILGCNPVRRSTFTSRNNRRCERLSYVLLSFRFLFLEHSDSLLQKMFSLAVYEAQDVGIPLLQSIQLLNLHWKDF